MKRTSIILLSVLAAATSGAQTIPVSSWSNYGSIVVPGDRSVVYNLTDEGTSLPILWGFDTAWNDYGNMLRGIRYAGASTIGVARVSFQPWDVITEKGVLPEMLQKNLESRLKTVSLLGRKVDIALNLDGGERTVKDVYGYLDENQQYVGNPETVADAYARLIDATAASVQAAGYRVISAAPFNEPDYYWNGTPINVFHEINKRLKNFNEYPRFRDIRISGGNTLNCDQALPWYTELKEYLDEGNTHQLAGDFDHYAEFFATVRADGKYATADELHNVMEAMVGVEYGMQTGIWWGTAEQARGEFCKASSGKRLAYAENRKAWSAASVYRAPSGKVMGFLGCSERQAMPSTYSFVSRSGDVFVNGIGPLREYNVSLPGDPDGAYQTELQRNAETVIFIGNSEDVQPVVSGNFALVNAASHKVLGGKDGSTANGTDIVQQTYTGAPHQLWTVSAVPENTGGDFSYYFIRNTADGQALDDMNWNLEIGGKVIAYAPSTAGVQQWAFEYDGDGWFHIRNKQSALYLDVRDTADGTAIVQTERYDGATQKWRLLPTDAPLEFDAPAAPRGLKSTIASASITLGWDAVADGGKITYTVLRSLKDANEFITIARGLETTSFVDNSVDGHNAYDYKVYAQDASGNRSGCSETVSARTEGNAMIARFTLNETLDCETENAFSIKTLNNATYRNGPQQGTKALYSRGQQYAQLPYSILSSDDFTVTLWAYRSSPTDDTRIFTTGVSEEETLYLTPSTAAGMKLVAKNKCIETEIVTEAMPQSTWMHFAIVKQGGNLMLYVNGAKAGEATDCANAIPSDRILTYLGRRHEPTPTYFTGNFADVCVFNHALTPEGVIAAMNGEPSGVSDAGIGEAEIISIEYYNLQGIRLDAPLEKGITISRTVYSDGTARVEKIISE